MKNLLFKVKHVLFYRISKYFNMGNYGNSQMLFSKKFLYLK